MRNVLVEDPRWRLRRSRVDRERIIREGNIVTGRYECRIAGKLDGWMMFGSASILPSS